MFDRFTAPAADRQHLTNLALPNQNRENAEP